MHTTVTDNAKRETFITQVQRVRDAMSHINTILVDELTNWNWRQDTRAYMTDREFRDYAIKVCCAYHTVYGVYPAKVGIHWQRLRNIQPSGVNFPVLLHSSLMAQIPIDATLEETPPISFQYVPFEAVQGETVQWDEVYFASLGPLLDEMMVSGKQVIAMAERRSTRR